ncbi:hypothetical protein [Pseudomonas sp. NFPP19]|uniref:hypothetical protein n=1 Tax=Pseudomonas sp. NFPP19 TaxID=1566225 RepID=UPI0008AE8D32|nr:hypothetical protein [Pseudomonas sp. NFPP19]SEP61409.1 hypothetical protein SAMN03159354_00049 [Pseudomonas sp. NFPP19]
MNHIRAAMHQSKYTKAPHPVFTLDDVPLDSWIKGVIYDGSGADSTEGLVPAQGWLIDDEHAELAWQLLTPASEDCSSIVPLLICPDDMDLSCTVAVVEQVVRGDKLIWERFGRAVTVIDGLVTAVAWNSNAQRAEFSRQQFDEACTEFKRLTEHEWA